MDIQSLIEDYTQWLRKEIKFEKIGEYYEISTPFLDNKNDCIQFYVRMDGDVLYFTDDGFTINQLEMEGVKLNAKRKNLLNSILHQYGAEMNGHKIESKSNVGNFPQRKHMYIQAIMKVDDLFMVGHTRSGSDFVEEIQHFFNARDIFYSENVQFTGTSGFSHNYDFLLQRNRQMPERLCRIMNNPNKNNVSNILFAWQDTKPYRREDSKLIVFLNDRDRVGKGIEEAFLNYDANVIKWSEREEKDNLILLSA